MKMTYSPEFEFFLLIISILFSKSIVLALKNTALMQVLGL